MSQLGEAFRAYIASTQIDDCTISQLDSDHFVLTTPAARGEVNFYELDPALPHIVELRIVDLDCPDDPRFFLHFELDDEARAQQLFQEMCDQLQQHDLFDEMRILLCCTAGLTTTMFANKLQEAADTLSLAYSFQAMPLEQAQADPGSFDAVLLAPQVAFQRKQVADAFPEAAVVEIPAKVFASYDAGSCLKLVMHLLSDNTVFPLEDSTNLKLVREMENDQRIMVISVIRRPRNVWIGWRIYDRGTIAAQGNVSKRHQTLRDIEDILAALPLRGWHVSDLDAVGIAMPGIVNRDSVSDSFLKAEKHASSVSGYELGRKLSKRYGTKVFVDNNANAAAVGCYVSQDEYDSVVLHTQQTGYAVGGQGIVVDGHLLKGRGNFAGELRPLYAATRMAQESEDRSELAWTREGMLSIVAPLLAADISLIAPDAIFVAVDLIDDMDVLKEKLLSYFKGTVTDYLPDLIRVTDYRERVAIGELAMCLQKLHNPRPHRKH